MFYFFQQDWDTVKNHFKRTGSSGILRRVRAYDPSTLTPDIKETVKSMIETFTEETVLLSSAGAATFFKWVNKQSLF